MCSAGESRVASIIAVNQVGVRCTQLLSNKAQGIKLQLPNPLLLRRVLDFCWAVFCPMVARQTNRNRKIEIETTDNPVHNNCVCTAQTSKFVVDECSMLK